MKRVDPVVKQETLYILLFSLPLSALMQSAFLISGFWSISVLFGNLLGVAAAVTHFFLLGLTLQGAMGLSEDEVKVRMKRSQTFRTFLLFMVALIGHLLPVFHLAAVVIPFFFPRIAIAFRPLVDKKKNK